MCVVGGIIGAGVIGAAGTAIAGHEAAGATQSASNAAIRQQQSALQQQAQLSAPYRQFGESAIPLLSSLLGVSGGDPTAALRATPGYQFARQQGLQGVTNQASAMGLGLSGNTLEGLQQYGTGLADQTYQEAVANARNAVAMGQGAAAGQAANVGTAAGNISNALIGQGQTLAGIDANTIAGITKSLGGGLNNYMLANTLSGLQNPGGGGGAGGFTPNVGPTVYDTSGPGAGGWNYAGAGAPTLPSQAYGPYGA